MNAHIRTARTLADHVLLARAKTLADRERGTTAELIAHLMEVERRKLDLASGYSSMFLYCRDALLLSEAETFNRLKAARAARRFPVILDRLTEGAVNLTTVKLLAKHLTADNHLEVLESVRGLSRPEIENLVARLAPMPDVRTSVRKLPAPKSMPAPTPASSPAPSTATSSTATTTTSVSAVAPSGPPLFAEVLPLAPSPLAPPSTPIPTPTLAVAETRPAVVSPLSPDRYKLQLTITGETLEKLELVKDMIRHAGPSGDVAQIFDRAMTLLLHDLAKKKFAATDRHRPSQGVAPESHKVSAEVKRVVYVRDLGCCAFVGKGGRRCNERASLEFHHVRPFVEGGPPTAENIALRCQAHNLYEWHLRSTEVRAREEEWLYRQVAAGVVPWTATTGPGTSPGSRRKRVATDFASPSAARPVP